MRNNGKSANAMDSTVSTILATGIIHDQRNGTVGCNRVQHRVRGERTEIAALSMPKRLVWVGILVDHDDD